MITQPFYRYIEFTLAQDKAFNALVYLAERIKPLFLTKAINLLYLADEMAVRQTGVPITWLNYKVWKLGPVPEDIYQQVKFAHHQYQKGNGSQMIKHLEVSEPLNPLSDDILLAPAEAFDDSQFSDYDIEVLDHIIKAYGELNFVQKSNRSDFIIELMELLDTDFKRSAFEVAYQSYLMQNEICGIAILSV
ncbi:SocA family protein [Pedobacter sp. MR2016-19]|uniref:Panacea domain-containing protein n=1 Tax=Pedobacter sp. MR2016-19 TaxID=2780089 RepID=UPI001875913E|nr:Panacea domain-containing protein [Pedobacter sp. MR2016-19]MBE5320939.1 SocA family protein [Pedobacter sp. MR2016-19]